MTHKLLHEHQAQLDGQIAALRGQDFKENPHPLNTTKCRAWSRGWRVVRDPAS
jgi:hypothetical protein